MRLLMYLLIAVSLVVGVVGAMTAYLPSTSGEDAPQRLAGLHLNAPAGRTPSTSPSDAPQPLVADKTTLTGQFVRELQSAEVKRVRVREFAFVRWDGRWLFLLGCVGLLVSGLWLRAAGRAVVRATDAAAATQADSPETLLGKLREAVNRVLQAPASSATILEHVGELQKTLMPAMIETRPQMIAAGGLARYAYFMDSYAAAERALNRAWSSAADDDMIEATASLRRAASLLEESAARLPQRHDT
jgi:hypothetical protein